LFTPETKFVTITFGLLCRWCLALDFIIYQTWKYFFNCYCNICFVVLVRICK